MSVDTPRSHVSGIRWPPLFNAQTSAVMAVGFQLKHSEWWSPHELLAHQLQQLREVVRHAIASVPLYQRLYADHRAIAEAEELSLESWSRLPVVQRQVLLDAEDELLSRSFPTDHGKPHAVQTSGSTGKPLRVLKSGVCDTMWSALTLREHAWHGRDLGAHLAAIRHVKDAAKVGAVPPAGASQRGWGSATNALYPQAKTSLLSIATPVDEQATWLERTDPDYLLTYPSNLDALVQVIRTRGVRLPSLREVRTISEAMAPDLRERCDDVLGVPLVDLYSAEEVGQIALQCPEAPSSYHVMSESVFVEVLDERGEPCGPGETGRVVVSALHNLATPILRYALGDYARVGAPCSCGRGLPVLDRILGRRRAMLRHPDGRVVWPEFTGACRRAAPFRVIQVIQESLEHIRMLVVPDGELEDAHERALRDALAASFGADFEITIERVTEIPRTQRGKLDEFVSRLD